MGVFDGVGLVVVGCCCCLLLVVVMLLVLFVIGGFGHFPLVLSVDGNKVLCTVNHSEDNNNSNNKNSKNNNNNDNNNSNSNYSEDNTQRIVIGKKTNRD